MCYKNTIAYFRNFCCDCGNSKFPSNKCTLALKEKSDVNEKNVYNHNFMGKYCTCEKPYPDPEDTNPDEMVQCVMCEDWHHNKVVLQNSLIRTCINFGNWKYLAFGQDTASGFGLFRDDL